MLTDEEQSLLDFAASAPGNAALRNQAIRQQLGISPWVYYQRLNRLLDRADALAAAPSLVYRLRAQRELGPETWQ